MTAPTASVRALTYARDNHRCVACGQEWALQWHHRESSGAGGRGVKAPRLTPADGLTACAKCNAGFEAEGQRRALDHGWKLRRNRGGLASSSVPYFDSTDRCFYFPNVDGTKDRVDALIALDILDLAGNLQREAS